MAKRWTSMSVHNEVYERVRAKKEGGESFNEVIRRLCELEESLNAEEID